MKNKEKYFDDIIKMFIEGQSSCEFRKKHIKVQKDCWNYPCSKCNENFEKWLEDEYIEPVDWTKVPMNIKIMVRDDEYASWCIRTFVFYHEGTDYLFVCIAENGKSVIGWKYAKLMGE